MRTPRYGGMNKAQLTLLALTAIGVSVTALGADGSVCIAPVPKATAGTKSLANATASAVPYEFEVTLGELAPVTTSHTESRPISGLDTSKSHLVVIRQGAKRVVSFRLRFQNYRSENLCLWFGPLYESWSLWPESASRGKCTCSASTRSNKSLGRARGRLNRKHYWINGLLSVLLLPVLFALVGVLTHMLWVVTLSKVVIAWTSIVLVARRTHDFGCSGWWACIYAVCLLFAAPFLKRYGVAELPAFFAPFLVLLVFGVIAGDRAANRFGMPQGDGPQMSQVV